MKIVFDDYESYRMAQIAKNIRKFNTVWAKKPEIKAIADIVKSSISNPTFGICHGVRNGWEVMELKKMLSCSITGTDISHTVVGITNCVAHDFHEDVEKWNRAADFVYSNSLDHAYDPRKALNVWVGQIKLHGLLFVGWFEKNGIDAADCFMATHAEIRAMLERYGEVNQIDVNRNGYLVHWVRIGCNR